MGAPTILLVDDDLDLLQLIATALDEQGYHVVLAKDGEEGKRFAEQIHPDLIVADIDMPELDGLQMAKELKKDEKTRRTPIIFLTVKGRPGDVVTGINAGARHYLTKPFEMRDLLDKVNRTLTP